MARRPHPGTLTSSRFALGPARAEDDEAIRELLRDLPMEGPIRLTFEREPAARLAAEIEGERNATVLARERGSGRVVGMGSRTVRWVWIDGEPARVGYLAQLRRRRELTGGRRLLVGGYAACEAARRKDEAPYDVTCILAGNRAARRLLERGLRGLPVYRRLAELRTLILPVRRRAAPPDVERAGEELLPEIARNLQENLRRYQFAPLWTEDDLRSPARTRGLAPEDFFVVRDGVRVVGSIALWDQRSFKQVVVHGYSPPLDRWRPWDNLGLTLGRRPRLPAAGTPLRLAYLSHLAVDGDDPQTAVALVRAARREAAGRGLDYLVTCLAAANPMLAAVRRCFPCRELASWLYLTHYGNAPPALEELGRRCPHLEAATL